MSPSMRRLTVPPVDVTAPQGPSITGTAGPGPCHVIAGMNSASRGRRLTGSRHEQQPRSPCACARIRLMRADWRLADRSLVDTRSADPAPRRALARGRRGRAGDAGGWVGGRSGMADPCCLSARLVGARGDVARYLRIWHAWGCCMGYRLDTQAVALPARRGCRRGFRRVTLKEARCACSPSGQRCSPW